MRLPDVVHVSAICLCFVVILGVMADEAKAAPPVLHGDAAKTSFLEALIMFMALDDRRALERANREPVIQYQPQRLMGVASIGSVNPDPQTPVIVR